MDKKKNKKNNNNDKSNDNDNENKFSIDGNEEISYEDSSGANNNHLNVNAKDLEEFDDEKNESTSRLTMILNLLKTIKAGIGADLTNIELPGSFVLPKSTLTYFNEIFLNNFELLLNANKIDDPIKRMLEIFKYLNSIFVEIPDPTRKPLNPILGEALVGKFHVKEEDGKINTDNHYFVEQVSHHPPLSVATIYNKKEGIKIYFTAPVAFIFAGTYFKISFEGDFEIFFEKYNETYYIQLPPLCGRYLRSFTEMTGTGIITSNVSPYTIKSQYHAKPLIGGAYNTFECYLYNNLNNEKLLKLYGQWDDETKIIDYSISSKESKLFYKRPPTSLVAKIEEPLPNDSKKVWEGVINAYNKGNIKLVSKEKSKVEQEQRKLAAERKQNNQKWVPRYYIKNEINNKWELKENYD